MTYTGTLARWKYNGNGSTDTFAYTTKILTKTDLDVIVDGTTKTVDTHYTVTGVGSAAGGSVVFTAGNIPASGTDNVVIVKDIPRDQQSSFPRGGSLDTATLEDSLDKLTMVVQQLETKINRTLRQTDSDATDIAALPTKANRASKILSFDSNGDPTATGAASISVATEGTGIDISGGAISVDLTELTSTPLSAVTPVGADFIVIGDASDSNNLKVATATNVIALAAAFASGTVAFFGQTSAPTGWTKDTTTNNAALRLVSGSIASGGTADFTTVFDSRTPAGSITVNGTSLSTAQLASHAHPTSAPASASVGAACGANVNAGTLGNSGNAGSGSTHDHTASFVGTAMDFDVKHVDCIRATKD